MPLRALRSVPATHPPGCAKCFGTSRRPNRAPRGCLIRQDQAPNRGGPKGAPLRSNASSRRREREEARVGEKEQSSSHARVSERRKALAILPAAPPFAGRRKKRVFGRRVVQETGSNRRGSLQPPAGRDGDNGCSGAFEEGRSRSREPFARGGPTRRHASRIVQGRPWAERGARGGKLPRQRCGGSLGVVGYPVTSRSFGRRRRERPRKGTGLASRGRESDSGAGEDRTLVGRARASFKCVAEVDGRCPDPEKRERGYFLTKLRARVTGDLALPLSRGAFLPQGKIAPKAAARERASRHRIAVAKPRDRRKARSVASRRR